MKAACQRVKRGFAWLGKKDSRGKSGSCEGRLPDARTGDIFCSVETKRFARREDLGLTPAEFAVLRRLDSPRKIQAFLYDMGQNFELKGDTCRPVRMVLRTRTAHCIEGAMLAATALWIQGEPPLVMDMPARRDELRHYPVLRTRQFKALLPRDPFEKRVGALLQYRRPRALIQKLLK